MHVFTPRPWLAGLSHAGWRAVGAQGGEGCKKRRGMGCGPMHSSVIMADVPEGKKGTRKLRSVCYSVTTLQKIESFESLSTP
jgi:hypothetical protein